MKKLVTFLLAFIIGIGAASAQSGTCGDNLTWSLSGGTLTISGIGIMDKYDGAKLNAPWYKYRKNIKTIIINDGVATIGDYAFAAIVYLTSVTIPNSVTSIGGGAFYGCSSLTSITIPNSVTSIGSTVFSGCTFIRGNFVNNSLLDASYRNYWGAELVDREIDGLLIRNDSIIDCRPVITSVIIPDYITCIGDNAFALCTSLKSITIPNSVTSIGGGAFRECSFTSITIPNSVINIGDGAFYGCYLLSSIDVVDSNPNYCSIDGVLFSKDKTTLIQCPIGNTRTEYAISNSVTSIGNYAFQDCSSLTSVTIPNSIISIGENAFAGCRNLTSMTIPNGVTSIKNATFNSCSKLSSIIIGNDVTTIGDYAFALCTSLKSITIPNSVTSIGEGVFHDCSSLASIAIGNSVKTIGNFAFNGTAIYNDQSNWESGVFYVGNYLIVANTNISGSYTIKEGTLLLVGNAFANCTSLTSITIPNSVTSISERVFEGCSSLSSITIPNSVTSIEYRAFYGCSSLTSVTIPNSVTSIGDNAFYDCSSLASITIPNSVTSIGSSAFSGCKKLTSIIIPLGVTSIGNRAFRYCTSLKSVYNYATTPQEISYDVFLSVGVSKVTLYVPAESISAYQSAAKWKEFIIEPICATTATTEKTTAVPSENEVEITWPEVSGAATYELVIKDKDGNIVCTLIFNANGQLTSIAFNAPSRNGVPAQTQSAGFSFTITGLDSGTNYDLTLTAKDNSGNIIEETTIPFHTDYPEGIENVQGDEVQSTKVIKDGQVLILRNGKTYTMQGQEVK